MVRWTNLKVKAVLKEAFAFGAILAVVAALLFAFKDAMTETHEV